LNSLARSKEEGIESSEGGKHHARNEIKKGREALSKKYNVLTPEEQD
jgi:hypothetical protein